MLITHIFTFFTVTFTFFAFLNITGSWDPYHRGKISFRKVRFNILSLKIFVSPVETRSQMLILPKKKNKYECHTHSYVFLELGMNMSARNVRMRNIFSTIDLIWNGPIFRYFQISSYRKCNMTHFSCFAPHIFGFPTLDLCHVLVYFQRHVDFLRKRK